MISNLGIVEGEIVPNLVMLAYGSDGPTRTRCGSTTAPATSHYLLDVTAVVLAYAWATLVSRSALRNRTHRFVDGCSRL